MSNDWNQGEYSISTDQDRLDVELIHDFLSNKSYWARGRSFESTKRAIKNSLSFGLYKGTEQIGFARVLTDYAALAWLADVFILEEFRGQGLAKWLMEVIASHSRLQGLRRWLLATKDAHELYRRFGFTELNEPSRWMEKFDPAVSGDR
jgi:GNAT superfamily N-acetyltransferase